MAPGRMSGFPCTSTSAVRNSRFRLVSAALAIVSAWSCEAICASTMPSFGWVDWNLASVPPEVPPGMLHSSSPGCAVPVSGAFPAESQPPTSTWATGRRKFATGKNVFRSSPNVTVKSSCDEIVGRSKCSSDPSM